MSDTQSIVREFQVYKCSTCPYVSTGKSILNTHIRESTNCRNAAIIDVTATGHFQPSDAIDLTTIPQTTSGPKPWDDVAFFRGRVTAFEDEAMDERIEYLFAHPRLVDILIERQTQHSLLSLPMKLYEYLWGHMAPVRFQSIVARSRKYVYLESVDDRGEPYMDEYSSKRDFEGRVVEYLFDFLRTLFVYSIPERRPELVEQATMLSTHLLEKRVNGVTYLDIITKKDNVHKHREALERTQMKDHAILIRNNVAHAMAKVTGEDVGGTDTVPISFHAFACTTCPFVTTAKSLLNVHTRCKKCMDSAIMEADVTAHVPCHNPMPRIKSGPKPFDAAAYFKGRIAAYDDDAFDQRIDYLFERDDLIQHLIVNPGYDNLVMLPAKYYRYLWGHDAPTRFQSILARSNKYIYVDSVRDDGTLQISEDNKVQLERRMMYELLEFIHGLCTLSIPARRPDLVDRANYIRNRLVDRRFNGVRFSEYALRSDLYVRRRKELRRDTTIDHLGGLIRINLSRVMECMKPHL